MISKKMVLIEYIFILVVLPRLGGTFIFVALSHRYVYVRIDTLGVKVLSHCVFVYFFPAVVNRVVGEPLFSHLFC